MKPDYDACFMESETIADPIYGMVEISAFEKRLINCREFQRLKHIRQLGFAHLVYPAAEHTRFAHSIGVCYQAKRLIERINLNLLREKRYREWRENGAYRGLSSSQLKEIKEIERVIIAAAGLLHDLPHAPFSHDIEAPSNYSPELGIPSHDDFFNNPAFYRYLFDTEFSQVASIIKIYNRLFWRDGICSSERGGQWGNAIKKEWGEYLTDDGYIIIADQSDDKALIRRNRNDIKIEKLPILGVMIFEIHVFDKEKDWLFKEKDKSGRRMKKLDDTKESVSVKVGWDNHSEDYLSWKPMRGWFRPYRKEIIGNTICADLIDYIQRDGHNSGIISHVDLKFLDRMTLTRAIIGDGDPIDLLFPWKKIPETCEHVVFDIYDHKRGFIRQSVITEVLACLHARYLLCERVYQHRVVEGARAMLQQLSTLLCEAGVISIETIHKKVSQTSTEGLFGDDIFLGWVCALDEEKYAQEKKDNVAAAKELAGLLFERRVYREAVIIDGIHGFEPPGTIAGACKNCEALADSLLPSDEGARKCLEDEMEQICSGLKEKWLQMGKEPAAFPKLPTLIGAREFGKRYKVPLVLVAKPYKYPEEGAPLEIQPLSVCQDPSHIKEQLKAMESAYDSLWRVYLFLHPMYHKKGDLERDAHRYVEQEFLAFMNNTTKIGWRNSVDFSQLLPEESIDVQCFIQDEIADEQVDRLKDKIIYILAIASKRYFAEQTSQKEADAFAARCYEPFRRQIRDDSALLSLLSNGAASQSFIEKFASVWQLEKIPASMRRTDSPDFYEKAAKRIYNALKETTRRLI